MGLFSLSETDDWQLEHDNQDIRGWTVQDSTGNEVGRVSELIASTENERVESIRLDTGEEFPARSIELHDGVVYVEGRATPAASEGSGTGQEPVIRKYDNTRVSRRQTPDQV